MTIRDPQDVPGSRNTSAHDAQATAGRRGTWRSTGILTAFLILAGSGISPAGTPARRMIERRVSADGTVSTRLWPAGHGIVQTLDRGRIVASRPEPLDGVVRVIVQFRSQPAALARQAGRADAAPAGEIDRLRQDLDRLSREAALGFSGGAVPAPVEPIVTREFRVVTSGAAVTLDARLVAAVRALPYVLAVHRDVPVRAVLTESVPLVRADQLRNEYGVGGEGIRVGILDTGVDYNHPAFGGGFGPGNRIAGGYDYANNDADPFDDHGHGTHVAGIVGGNGGGIVGVAPLSTLYALKVLDAEGLGWTSNILAAFDDVPDPDHDPGTHDGLQVVNISFGAPGGRSDDILAQGVDNLVALGVVCAVAAGNEGTFQSIGTPGTARDAITVAATDKMDFPAWFSSRGPVTDNLDLKPDVAAPGVDIVSSAMGGGAIDMSGTSMATPHVAGVAALLRQIHPDWQAADVKSAIVSQAWAVGGTPLEVGSGRMDAFEAAAAEIAVTPPHLSFGMADVADPEWSVTKTLVFRNLLADGRDVNLPALLTIAPGATLEVDPSIFTLPPNGSQVVEVTLIVDHEIYPWPPEPPFAQTGILSATSEGRAYRIPLSFHKANRLTVQSSGSIYQLNVVDHLTGELKAVEFYPTSILLSPGNYDLMASFFPDWVFVVHENVSVPGIGIETIEPTEATVHLTWNNVDAAGQPAACNDGKLSYVGAPNTGLNFVGFPFTEIWSSPTDRFRLEWERAATDFREHRITFNGTVAGFSTSGTVTNLPSDLHHLPIDVPAVGDSAAVLFFPLLADGLGGWMGFGGLRDVPALIGPWTFDQWVMNAPARDHFSLGELWNVYAFDASGRIDLTTDLPGYYGPTIRFDEGWPLPFYSVYDPWMLAARFGGGRARLAGGMPLWRGQFRNAPNRVSLDQMPDALWLHCETDMYGTVGPTVDPTYSLTQAGQQVSSGVIAGMGSLTALGTFSLSVPEIAPADIHLEREYDLGGHPAVLMVDAHLNLPAADPDPPQLLVWNLTAGGVMADSIDFNQAAAAAIRFRARDANAPIAGTVSVRPAGAGLWTPLPNQPDGEDFVAVLPNTLDGLVDVRFESEDPSGNRLRITWSPGFAAHGAPVSAAPGPAELKPVLSLIGPRRNPVHGPTLRIAFSLASGAPARLALFDLQGRVVASRRLEGEAPGFHELELSTGPGLASGIYFIRLTQGGESRAAKVSIVR